MDCCSARCANELDSWALSCLDLFHYLFAFIFNVFGVQVVVLRERRLDQEDVLADITRSCDTVKKEQESLKQKLKRLEQARHATEADIEDFQREKQAALNEIEVTVMVHAHQIEYLVDGKMPTDLSGALLFSNAELARLRSRIDVRRCLGLLYKFQGPVPIPSAQ